MQYSHSSTIALWGNFTHTPRCGIFLKKSLLSASFFIPFSKSNNHKFQKNCMVDKNIFEIVPFHCLTRKRGPFLKFWFQSIWFTLHSNDVRKQCSKFYNNLTVNKNDDNFDIAAPPSPHSTRILVSSQMNHLAMISWNYARKFINIAVK